MRLRWEYWALLVRGNSPDSSRLTEVHFRLGSRFDLDFLQIPHWQGPIPVVSGTYLVPGFLYFLSGGPCFLRTPLSLRLDIPLPQGCHQTFID